MAGMRFSWYGIVPAVVYVLIAVAVSSQEFNCGSGLGVNPSCGLGAIVMTLPSYVTLGRILARFGIEIDFHRSAQSIDMVLLGLHITVCAILVYFMGSGVAWVSANITRLISGTRDV